MKAPQKINKSKITLDLPTHRVWKKVEEFQNQPDNNQPVSSPKEMGQILDQAFSLLLRQLIRQN